MQLSPTHCGIACSELPLHLLKVASHCRPGTGRPRCRNCCLYFCSELTQIASSARIQRPFCCFDSASSFVACAASACATVASMVQPSSLVASMVQPSSSAAEQAESYCEPFADESDWEPFADDESSSWESFQEEPSADLPILLHLPPQARHHIV